MSVNSFIFSTDDTYLQKFDDFKLCQSSTADDQSPCEQAFDGRLDLAWMPTLSLSGEWIQVTFEEEHDVFAVEVWFSKITKGQCKKMSFRFVRAALLQVKCLCFDFVRFVLFSFDVFV